jgi:hypothetical protein
MKRIDLGKIRPVSIKDRKSKVNHCDTARNLSVEGVAAFVESLPDLLKARDFKQLIESVIRAHRRGKPIIWLFGAHLVKVGLAPLLSEIIEAGWAQQISTNNAGLIHDLELAFFGATSEDVESSLVAGEFGMTGETAELYTELVDLAAAEEIGLGAAAGKYIDSKVPAGRQSLFAAAYRKQVPATVHVAIGADVVNCHPRFDGAKVGLASQIDFEVFCANVLELKEGGVALNFGSAVLMPEVFLKAMAVARNLDAGFSEFVTADFDMIAHYRPHQNLVNRPRLLGAESYAFTGHHEIMLPLLWAAINDNLETP